MFQTSLSAAARFIAGLGMLPFLLIFGATGVCYFESTAQLEHFGSIAGAAWWAIATGTLVGWGYGYPATIPAMFLE